MLVASIFLDSAFFRAYTFVYRHGVTFADELWTRVGKKSCENVYFLPADVRLVPYASALTGRDPVPLAAGKARLKSVVPSC